MEWRGKPRIGVMGPSGCSTDVQDLAREVGRCIARAGGILICGGLGGVMEAAARGAKEYGGLAVGILPGRHAVEANPYIDIPIVTGMGNARNVINVLSSQAVIAIHGSHGTLSEIALALKCGVPVIGLQTWGLTTPGGCEEVNIVAASTPEEAVAIALEKIKSQTSRC
jgi:uncharacterized protein (TIGR00725 family)